ncbi:hypothetical protein PMIT1313_01145 [Prochlorococcus marinus str. MIT 1313]|uniref:autotransporter domain-containing protein n=1 Tax=Prochlorococcus TaxID=1218 RepID=UPI0007B33AAB|nr:autotransporter domain-containing protein [Prochlorococcus marinus]KZR69458.1 hypothetical protein PMIT1313_01145 [Prochlorococcus marinus str. MIT 1313]
MRSKSLPISVAVFLAAATPSIVFDASRAQVGTADFATNEDEEVAELALGASESNPCAIAGIVTFKPCDVTVKKDIQYKKIQSYNGFLGTEFKDSVTVNSGQFLIIDTGGTISLYGNDDIITNNGTINGDIFLADGNDIITNNGTITGNVNMGPGTIDTLTNAGATIAGDITMGDGKNSLANYAGSTITGNIDMGDGNDELDNYDGSIIKGNIDMGDGDDSTLNKKGSTITGDIAMGAGNDKIYNHNGSIIDGNGTIKMGDGNDRLTNNENSTIAANSIQMGNQKDIFTNSGKITGKTIYMGAQNDTFTNDEDGDIGLEGNIYLGMNDDELVNYGTINAGGIAMSADNDTNTVVNTLINYSSATITLAGTLSGSPGADSITNTGTITADSIAMGDGSNMLTNKGGSTITLTGNLSGGSGVDSITNAGSTLSASDIDLGAANDTLSNTNAGTIIVTNIKMRGGADEIKNYGEITTVENIQMAGGADTLINYKAGTITSKKIAMGNGDDVLKNKGTLNVDSISLGSGNDVIYVDSPINARKDDGTVTIDGGSDLGDIDVVRFGADGGKGTIDGSHYINFEKAVQEGGTWNYDKDFSHIPQFVVRGGVMQATDDIPATFKNLTLKGGTIQTDIHDHDGASYPAPIKVAGSFIYETGSLVISAEKITNPTGTFNIIDVVGSETEISKLASNTILRYGEQESASFTGLGKENELTEPALRDVYLEKGSLLLVVEDKTKDEITDPLDPGNSGGGSIDELLPGCDGDEDLCDIIADHPDDDDAADEDEDIAGNIVDEILLPINDSDDDVALPLIDYGQLARLVVSGLIPRNVDGPGQSMATYNNLLVDTVFERLPLRQFQGVEQPIEQSPFVEEESVEEMQPQQAEPVRGLWMKSAAVDEQQALDYLEQEASKITVAQASGSESASVDGETVITIDGIDYVDRDSLTTDYSERDGMRAWFRGFGGSSSFSKSSTIYNGYDISHGGGVVGVDVSIAKNIQLGAYANYGQINLSQNSSDTGGGSWNPSGWGGGITADWWADNFYIQGLLGGTGFSGDQKRDIVAIADGWGSSTSTGDKSSTSYVGAVRLGAPFDLGSVLLEPQFSAVWTRNDENSFSESSSHSRLNLKYHSRTTNYFQTDLGVKLAYPLKSGDQGLVVPSLKVAWLRDWDQNNAAQKIGYTFTDDTVSVESNHESQNGLLVEAGVDYTINNFGTTSFKVYGRGGLEFWDANRGTDWRASGGVTFQF